MTPRELINLATEARNNAYAPYSRFCVGAALLTADGKVYRGCNIENSSYSATLCAERAAFAAAISAGESAFEAIAIVGWTKDGKPSGACMPCGVCRQFMSELCDGDFLVFVMDEKGEIIEKRLDSLLPDGFFLKDFTEK